MYAYRLRKQCNRCVTSTTSNNRATNGHRYVFHSSEVVGSERCYISTEPGVHPYDMSANPVNPSRASGSISHNHLQNSAGAATPPPRLSISEYLGEERASQAGFPLSRRSDEWEGIERDRRARTPVPAPTRESLTTRGLRIMNQSQSHTSQVHRSPPPLILPELSPSPSDYSDNDDDEPPPLEESSPTLDNDGGAGVSI